jgi:hypothetical protein
MNTHFDKPERAAEADLTAEIAIVNDNPVMTGLLNTISGLIAVVDEHRQVVALNISFLKTLGVDDPSETLGLRLGEVLECIHAYEEPAGCGTTKYCSTCGAAIAILASATHDTPTERMCALTANRKGATLDLALLVRSSPIRIDAKRFLLLFIQDVTLQQQRAALERTFFHDINNMLCGLTGTVDLLTPKGFDPAVSNIIRTSSLRLFKEIEIQRQLIQSEQFLPIGTI